MSGTLEKRKEMYRMLWKACFDTEQHLASVQRTIVALVKDAGDDGTEAPILKIRRRERLDLMESLIAMQRTMIILSSRRNGIFEHESGDEK